MKASLYSAVAAAMIIGCGQETSADIHRQTPTPTPAPSAEPSPSVAAPVGFIPSSTRSILNGMDCAGLNTHHDRFRGSPRSDVVTLGPREDQNDHFERPDYPRNTLSQEVVYMEPILAPFDMELIGFDNRNATRRVFADGRVLMPYDDTQLWFFVLDPAWWGTIFSLCRIRKSPLLTGQFVHEECGVVDDWDTRRAGRFGSGNFGSDYQADGIVYYSQTPIEPYTTARERAQACGGQLGTVVRRGQVIGYAGNVGGVPEATILFLVRDDRVSNGVNSVPPVLHFVQPAQVFCWRCAGGEEADYAHGVAAYPFACNED